MPWNKLDSPDNLKPLLEGVWPEIGDSAMRRGMEELSVSCLGNSPHLYDSQNSANQPYRLRELVESQPSGPQCSINVQCLLLDGSTLGGWGAGGSVPTPVSPLEVSNEIPPAPVGPQSWHHH